MVAGASLADAREAGVAAFAYGSFIMAVINFLIIAFAVFMLVKRVNAIKEAAAKEEAVEEEPAGPTDNELLQDILVALKK